MRELAARTNDQGRNRRRSEAAPDRHRPWPPSARSPSRCFHCSIAIGTANAVIAGSRPAAIWTRSISRSLLPSVFLIHRYSRDPFDLVFRLAGTVLTGCYGSAMTGEPPDRPERLRDDPSLSPGGPLRCAPAVPVLISGRLAHVRVDAPFNGPTILLLPLGETPGRVDMLIGCAHFPVLPDRRTPRAAIPACPWTLREARTHRLCGRAASCRLSTAAGRRRCRPEPPALHANGTWLSRDRLFRIPIRPGIMDRHQSVTMSDRRLPCRWPNPWRFRMPGRRATRRSNASRTSIRGQPPGAGEAGDGDLARRVGICARTRVAGCPTTLGITSCFRVLSDEGVDCLQEVVRSLERFTTSNSRIERNVRGGTYRSQFLRDLCLSPDVAEVISEICDAPMAPHTIPHAAGPPELQPVGYQPQRRQMACRHAPGRLRHVRHRPERRRGRRVSVFPGHQT